MNPYDIDNEACPECGSKELVFIINCNGIHCQDCGRWFDLRGNLLEDEE